VTDMLSAPGPGARFGAVAASASNATPARPVSIATMKNATKHAEVLRSHLRSLLREQKPAPIERLDPLKALVRGAMSADVSDARADEAVRAIDREFVNLNELRVATEPEVHELLGARYPGIEKRVQLITRCLNAIFEKEHTLSLDRLKTISKRDARQFLRDLPDITPFVEAYVMLYGFEGATAVPVDDEMLEYLREEGIVDEKASIEEAQRFLENNLKGDECYDFFASVRRAIFAPAKGKKK
jgi:endonuclease III